MPAPTSQTHAPGTDPVAESVGAAAAGGGSVPVSTVDTPLHRYNAELADQIERNWQELWAAQGTFHAPNPVGELAAEPGSEQAERARRPKLFVQDMFPYPSGTGLHVGHPLGYIATDVFARFARMDGHNVLHTLGYDAFGLPAEQYAVQTGQHPRVTTEANIANMRSQLHRLGLGHDSRRSVATTDTDYYRWTQWIFLRIFNSWYDTTANKARPIAELIEQFRAGERVTPNGLAWAELSPEQQRSLINSHRLAYLSQAPVNWCPGLGTVLSNEEVTADGRSDRGNFPVFKRSMRQWMMRITAYADRLIDDLATLDWPEPVAQMQRNWIGRSYGARVEFAVADAGTPGDGSAAARPISVFTTRPDTLFGCNSVVLAPEHPAVPVLLAPRWPDGTPQSWTGGAATPADAVAQYREQAAATSEIERQAENREKTGVFTGGFALNPANGARLPIFIADYVLIGYGTGAVMGVPGEDDRDWEFSETFGLPIVRTVQPSDGFDGGAYEGDGVMINSGFLDGMPWQEAKQTMIGWLAEHGHGTGTVSYKLRDWLFSRQRYWGEPFPIVYEVNENGDGDTGRAGEPIELPESMLPVLLPEVDDYSPVTYDPDDADTEPSPPLAKATDWTTLRLDLGDGLKTYRRDANVMPQWAGSCCYQLRYIDPRNSDELVDPTNERYWMGPEPLVHGADDPGGLDLYVGGVEHAVLHLLYARFWHKVLYDLGHVSSSEPYRRLFNQGYIQAPAFTDARGVYVPADEVVKDGVVQGGAEDADGYSWNGEPVHREYGKMGKSLKNVVTPEEMCAEYGADTFRVYEMSMGPLESSRPWESRAVVGAHRFLQRLWRVVLDEHTGQPRVTDDPADRATRQILHRTIDGVRADMTGLRFNTAIAKLIELTNHLTTTYPGGAPREIAAPLVLMVAPLAPHIAEELWRRLGNTGSLTYVEFPTVDEQLLVAETIEYPVQINGKVRARVTVAADADESVVRDAALSDAKVAAYVGEKTPRKVIVVPGRIVTVVV